MCHIFAGQSPSNYTFETRSVRLMGHPTSVRLEAKFWVVLEQLADAQNMPMAKFLSALYESLSENFIFDCKVFLPSDELRQVSGKRALCY